jgi:hypothetical protein
VVALEGVGPAQVLAQAAGGPAAFREVAELARGELAQAVVPDQQAKPEVCGRAAAVAQVDPEQDPAQGLEQALVLERVAEEEVVRASAWVAVVLAVVPELAELE